jgi:hypothetical protein
MVRKVHQIEPYYSWNRYYDSSSDARSPFEGKEYNYDQYSEEIYGYYIDPAWDYIGSETLYIKILFMDYEKGVAIIEFIGEWNDAINNDIMNLKRNIIDHLNYCNISKYILLGENVFNFHGSDDCYYEEWYEDVEEREGWIAALNFRAFVIDEWEKYNIDSFFNYEGELEISSWRTLKPLTLFQKVDSIIGRRIPLL